jgi:hypothetical protein
MGIITHMARKPHPNIWCNLKDCTKEALLPFGRHVDFLCLPVKHKNNMKRCFSLGMNCVFINFFCCFLLFVCYIIKQPENFNPLWGLTSLKHKACIFFVINLVYQNLKRKSLWDFVFKTNIKCWKFGKHKIFSK